MIRKIEEGNKEGGKKEPEIEESKVRRMAKEWDRKPEKEVEKDVKRVGRKKKLLTTSQIADQQPKVKNTDEKFVRKECQTPAKFNFRYHPRKIIKMDGSEENPPLNICLKGGLSDSQNQAEEK